jgi:hypothetical protein
MGTKIEQLRAKREEADRALQAGITAARQASYEDKINANKRVSELNQARLAAWTAEADAIEAEQRQAEAAKYAAPVITKAPISDDQKLQIAAIKARFLALREANPLAAAAMAERYPQECYWTEPTK